MSFVVKHPKRGLYVEHTSKPSFTWKHALVAGKRFFSRSEAEAVLKMPGMEGCTVEPDTAPKITPRG